MCTPSPLDVTKSGGEPPNGTRLPPPVGTPGSTYRPRADSNLPVIPHATMGGSTGMRDPEEGRRYPACREPMRITPHNTVVFIIRPLQLHDAIGTTTHARWVYINSLSSVPKGFPAPLSLGRLPLSLSCVLVAERSGAGTAYARSRTEFASAI